MNEPDSIVKTPQIEPAEPMPVVGQEGEPLNVIPVES